MRGNDKGREKEQRNKDRKKHRIMQRSGKRAHARTIIDEKASSHSISYKLNVRRERKTHSKNKREGVAIGKSREGKKRKIPIERHDDAIERRGKEGEGGQH